MTIKNTFLISTLFAGFLFSLGAYQTMAVDSGSFQLHLYFADGKLNWLDEGSYVAASTKPFVTPGNTTYPLYTVELYDSQDKLLVRANIDPRGDNPTLREGDEIVIVPFDKRTARIVVRDSKGLNVLGQDIALELANYCNRNKICEPEFNEFSENCSYDCPVESGQCNKNSICETDLGENWFTCLADCPVPNSSVQPAAQSSSGGSVFGVILYILGGLALVFVAWVIYRSRKNQSPVV